MFGIAANVYISKVHITLANKQNQIIFFDKKPKKKFKSGTMIIVLNSNLPYFLFYFDFLRC